jgi:cysteine sulfinate desulfinase/cysteine desulfurase-like protein
MGFDAARAAGAVRLSVGQTTTAAEVDRAAEAIVSAWHRLQAG